MTSVVFGVLQHLPPSLGLRPVLSHMEGPPPPSWLSEVTSVQTQFWPWWNEDDERDGAEPDVVLTFQLREGRPKMLVVEAKRKSGKSGHGEHDQLARQVANGHHIARRKGAEMAGLVYVTTHLSLALPTRDLDASREELGEDAPPLWWLSWRDFAPVLRAASECLAGPLGAQSQDAAACLERWGMERFRGGWHRMPSVPSYRFEPLSPIGTVLPAPPWTFTETTP